MKQQRGILDDLRSRGEALFEQVSGELMANPHFMKAMERALQGKAFLDRAVGQTLKRMNIPTRTEFKRALSRIESLEAEVAALKAKPKRAPRKRTTKAARAASPAAQRAAE